MDLVLVVPGNQDTDDNDVQLYTVHCSDSMKNKPLPFKMKV